MPLAISARDKKILLVQMDGLLTRDEIAAMLGMAERGCEQLHGRQADALKRFYEQGESAGFRM